jgi:hypothetical protein
MYRADNCRYHRTGKLDRIQPIKIDTFSFFTSTTLPECSIFVLHNFEFISKPDILKPPLFSKTLDSEQIPLKYRNFTAIQEITRLEKEPSGFLHKSAAVPKTEVLDQPHLI